MPYDNNMGRNNGGYGNAANRGAAQAAASGGRTQGNNSAGPGSHGPGGPGPAANANHGPGGPDNASGPNGPSAHGPGGPGPSNANQHGSGGPGNNNMGGSGQGGQGSGNQAPQSQPQLQTALNGNGGIPNSVAPANNSFGPRAQPSFGESLLNSAMESVFSAGSRMEQLSGPKVQDRLAPGDFGNVLASSQNPERSFNRTSFSASAYQPATQSAPDGMFGPRQPGGFSEMAMNGSEMAKNGMGLPPGQAIAKNNMGMPGGSSVMAMNNPPPGGMQMAGGAQGIPGAGQFNEMHMNTAPQIQMAGGAQGMPAIGAGAAQKYGGMSAGLETDYNAGAGASAAGGLSGLGGLVGQMMAGNLAGGAPGTNGGPMNIPNINAGYENPGKSFSSVPFSGYNTVAKNNVPNNSSEMAMNNQGKPVGYQNPARSFANIPRSSPEIDLTQAAYDAQRQFTGSPRQHTALNLGPGPQPASDQTTQPGEQPGMVSRIAQSLYERSGAKKVVDRMSNLGMGDMLSLPPGKGFDRDMRPGAPGTNAGDNRIAAALMDKPKKSKKKGQPIKPGLNYGVTLTPGYSV